MEKSKRRLRDLMIPVIHNMKVSVHEDKYGFNIFCGTNNKSEIPKLLELLNIEKQKLPEHTSVYQFDFRNETEISNKKWCLDVENELNVYTNTDVKDNENLVTGEITGYECAFWYATEFK